MRISYSKLATAHSRVRGFIETTSRRIRRNREGVKEEGRSDYGNGERVLKLSIPVPLFQKLATRRSQAASSDHIPVRHYQSVLGENAFTIDAFANQSLKLRIGERVSSLPAQEVGALACFQKDRLPFTL